MVHYRPGDLITTSRPYVYALNSSERGLRCDFCFQGSNSSPNINLKRCSSCKLTFYCNSECQRGAWKSFHKDECSHLTVFSSPCGPTETFLFFGRLASKVLKNDPQNSEEVCNISRTFWDLEAHIEDVRKDDERVKQFMVLEHFFTSFYPKLKCDKMMLMKIFGRMVVNTYTVLDSENQAIGSGLYLGASAFDHSCEPNSVAVFDRTSLNVRAIKDFECASHRDIFISYVDPINSTAERQKFLKDQYYFLCQCTNCSNISLDKTKTSVVKARESTVLLEQISGFLKSYTSQANLSLDEKKEFLDKCELLLKDTDCVLGEGHTLRVRLLDMAFDLCVDLQFWDKSLDFALPALKYYKMYYNNYVPAVGIQLFKVGKIYHWIGNLLKAEDTFLEAKRLLTVCHGNDHMLIKELNALLYQCKMEINCNQEEAGLAQLEHAHS